MKLRLIATAGLVAAALAGTTAITNAAVALPTTPRKDTP